MKIVGSNPLVMTNGFKTVIIHQVYLRSLVNGFKTTPATTPVAEIWYAAPLSGGVKKHIGCETATGLKNNYHVQSPCRRTDEKSERKYLLWLIQIHSSQDSSQSQVRYQVHLLFV